MRNQKKIFLRSFEISKAIRNVIRSSLYCNWVPLAAYLGVGKESLGLLVRGQGDFAKDNQPFGAPIFLTVK